MTQLSQQLCIALKGVGPKTAAALARLNINSVQDLLFHLPYRYQNRATTLPISQLQDGDTLSVEGHITHHKVIFARKRTLMSYISDEAGVMSLRFFNFTQPMVQFFAQNEGKRIRCYGRVRRLPTGFEMAHPEYELVEEGNAYVSNNGEKEVLTPVYPTTKGLHQMTLRKLTDQALTIMENAHALPELFPESILEKFKIHSITAALKIIHRPPIDVQAAILEARAHPAHQRLAFEELVAYQLSLRKLRHRISNYQAVMLEKTPLVETFLNRLPFELTQAQQRVIETISLDLKDRRPMMRLLQGDVGSGKTVVAAIAMLHAVGQGYQAALMAPTELLAEQHLQNFCAWFEPMGIKMVFLSGSLKAKTKRSAMEAIALGQAQIVIGTHALFQDAVQFKSLALLVIDEQHRFGVHQRLALREKGVKQNQFPHQLIMTATPIPRTLAMTAYADLDCSIIDELPQGRKPVVTLGVSNHRREEVLQRIRENCKQGRQVYWVCTLIEESDVLQCEAAEKTYAYLREALLNVRVGLVHGRMDANEKEQVMQAFKKGDLDVLVATTVIEVGVDVPNASLMIIENAERLGLAQLHQLRGRVGRGQTQSYCVLLYQAPLQNMAKKRIDMMRKSHDGFKISQYDLALRGPGEVLGIRQAGFLRFKIADLIRDQSLIQDAQEVADMLLKKYTDKAESLINRWIPAMDRIKNV